MKSLKSIKKQASALKEQVRIAEQDLQGCEHDYNLKPSEENALALQKARENYRKQYYLYESCISYINNYDFYRQCEQQEKEEAECRRLYIVA